MRTASGSVLTAPSWKYGGVIARIADIWVAAGRADRLIYLKIVSETQVQLTFGRQRYVQIIERWSMYQHVLIPTDGSELAERAVRHGLSVAKFVGAKVTVIIVEERLPGWLSFAGLAEATAQYAEQIKEHAASALDHVANAAKQAGVPCDAIQVKDVQPYEAIIATATNRGCDLIVMASHGRSGLSAVVLGGVTNKVLTHTKVPVLVVR
jgi:nucleotide-binding universal stress UspA family protein